jgi:hypothetical protein
MQLTFNYKKISIGLATKTWVVKIQQLSVIERVTLLKLDRQIDKYLVQ